MPFKATIVFPPTGKMDSDSDVKNVKLGDIIDAYNCRWGLKNDGTVNAVENIKGNWLLPINLPTGNNTIIGGCNDFPNNSVIVFMYNDQNKHSILKVNMLTKKINPILWEEPVLDFDDKFISNPHVQDGILYWLNSKTGELQNLRIDFWTRNTSIKYHAGIGYWELSEYLVQP